jgi:cytochrome c553
MKIEMQQMLELLLANQAAQVRMEAKMDTYHKKRMAMLDAHYKSIRASLGKTEATDFKVNPREMQPVMEGNPEKIEIVIQFIRPERYEMIQQ